MKNYLPAMSMRRIIEAAVATIKSIRLEERSKIPKTIIINVPTSTPDTNDSVLSETNGNGYYQAGEADRQVPFRKIELTYPVVLRFETDKIQVKTTGHTWDYLISQKRNRGILNVGNSCFLNAVLQMLFNRRLIRYLLLAE